MSESGKGEQPVVIKKYANRRLYDTASSRYVTLDHLRDLVRKGADFVVQDAKTGEDLTRGVLAQIIFEEEARGANLLPVQFLRQLISFYGDSLESVVPGYLQMSMDNFAQQQERMRERFAEALGSPQAAMSMMQEQTKRNMAMFEQAMRVFTPFAQQGEAARKPAPESDSGGESGEGGDLDALRKELDAMRAKIDRLAKDGGA
ncbi:MAG: polyhydroxyalkanoate synthesis repressor PhaR [Maricaulaceae bacterium]|nr:polyhydroxyalkanoate synthesis repressor PhaR [Maricaulaceae bacterium]